MKNCWMRLSWKLLQGFVVGFLMTGAGAAAAIETINIVLTEHPPYEYTENGKITGFSQEVVEAVLKEIKVLGDFQVLPWARAYDTALNTENVLIYSMSRTPVREKLFKWVGVVAPVNAGLFALRARQLKITHLDEAKKYQIGTMNNDAREQFLLSKGFIKGQHLQSIAQYEANYEKLKLGRIDLWATNSEVAHYLVRKSGDDPAIVMEEVYSLSDNEGTYMAFGAKTSDAVVDRFKQGLATVKKNGIFNALKKKWQF